MIHSHTLARLIIYSATGNTVVLHLIILCFKESSFSSYSASRNHPSMLKVNRSYFNIHVFWLLAMSIIYIFPSNITVRHTTTGLSNPNNRSFHARSSYSRTFWHHWIAYSGSCYLRSFHFETSLYSSDTALNIKSLHFNTTLMLRHFLAEWVVLKCRDQCTCLPHSGTTRLTGNTVSNVFI